MYVILLFWFIYMFKGSNDTFAGKPLTSDRNVLVNMDDHVGRATMH